MIAKLFSWHRAPVVLVASLIFGGCGDVENLVGPSSQPQFSHASGFEKVDGVTTINFDRSFGSGLYYDANMYRGLGITFDLNFVIYTSDAPGWSGLPRTPAASGEWALAMGSWAGYWPPPSTPKRTWNWYFRSPVSDLSFNVRPEGDFEITCFDAAGAAVDRQVAPGLRNEDGTLRVSDWYSYIRPYPLHRVSVQGTGISRCTLVSRGGIIDDLSFRLEPLSKVTLSCSPAAVTRGDPVTCTASSPESDWEVTGWKFVSSDGQEEVEPLDPAQESSPRWHGPMVRSGTVHVMATVGGEAQSVSAQVSVRDRDWSGRAPVYTFRRINNGEDSRLVLPPVVEWSHHLGAANWFRTETPASTVPDYSTEVPGGPNDGLNYFSDETTLRVFGYYVLNHAAMSRGSRFYAAQERGDGSGGTRIVGTNWCPARIVAESLPAIVEAHEQMHGSAYQQALLRQGAALTRLERTTASDVGVLYDEYDRLWEEMDWIARTESAAIHGQPGGLVSPTSGGRPCALRNEFGFLLQAEP